MSFKDVRNSVPLQELSIELGQVIHSEGGTIRDVEDKENSIWGEAEQKSTWDLSWKKNRRGRVEFKIHYWIVSGCKGSSVCNVNFHFVDSLFSVN